MNVCVLLAHTHTHIHTSAKNSGTFTANFARVICIDHTSCSDIGSVGALRQSLIMERQVLQRQ